MEDTFHYGYRIEKLPWVSFEEVGVAFINTEALKQLELDMQAERIDHMFRFTYEKSSEEIKEKAKAKIVALKAKVEERQKRVTKIRSEYGVTDEVWSGILELMREKANVNAQSYTVSNNMKSPGTNSKASEEVVVPAGIVNSILTEKDYISSETAQVTKLELVVRNLKDLKEDGEVRGHKLNETELTYLGF